MIGREARRVVYYLLLLHLCCGGSGCGPEESPSLSLVREDGIGKKEDIALRDVFYSRLAGEDDLLARPHIVRSPAPTVNVYGVGSLPRQRHPLSALAGAPAATARGSLFAKRVMPVLRVILWLAIRLAHKVAWGMHVLSEWVEARDCQFKQFRARQRGRPLKGLGSKFRASPIMHIYSEDQTHRGRADALQKLLHPDKHRTPGREYVLEMQRQAAGVGYRRRSRPFAAEAVGILGFGGIDRHTVHNIKEEGGRDWLLANGRAGEVEAAQVTLSLAACQQIEGYCLRSSERLKRASTCARVHGILVSVFSRAGHSRCGAGALAVSTGDGQPSLMQG